MEVLVPIFVCVVLPVSIVLIISLRKLNSDNKRAEILTRAIESGREVDTERLVESLRYPKYRAYSDKDILYARLLRGCICTLVGISLAVVYLLWPVNDIDSLSFLMLLSAVSTAIGIAYLIVFFVTRKEVLKEK